MFENESGKDFFWGGKTPKHAKPAKTSMVICCLLIDCRHRSSVFFKLFKDSEANILLVLQWIQF